MSMPSETIDEAQQALIEEFGFFDDWMQRYEYLIDLGRQLAPLDAEFLKDEFKLRGCQSQVWLIARHEDDKLVFEETDDVFMFNVSIPRLMSDGSHPVKCDKKYALNTTKINI